jgi:hypothetical protein
MTDLNSLLPPSSGWALVIATAINNTGGIVGLKRKNQPFSFRLKLSAR